jgi:hypothetical protein
MASIVMVVTNEADEAPAKKKRSFGKNKALIQQALATVSNHIAPNRLTQRKKKKKNKDGEVPACMASSRRRGHSTRPTETLLL